MKNLKKSCSVMLAALMTATLAFSCSESSNGSNTSDSGAKSGEKQNLIAMTWSDPSDAERIRDAMFEKFPDMAEKIDLEFVLGGGSNADVAEKYRLSLTSNSYICDILYMNAYDVPEFAEAGTLVELDDIYNADGIKGEIMPSALEAATYNEKLLAVPQELKQTLWFYNKTMFDEAGINPEEVTTTEDFIAAGKQFMEVFPETAFFHGVPKVAYNMVFNAMSHNDAVFSDDDGNFVVNSDPAIRKALEDIYSILHSGISVDIQEWTPEWESGFKDRVMASTLTESYFKTFGARLIADSEDEWAVTLWPAFGGEVGGKGEGGALVLMIPQSAKNIDLAKEWLQKCFLSKDGRTVLHDTSKVAPIRDDLFQEILNEEDADWGATYNPATYKAVEMGGMPAYIKGTQIAKERTIVAEYFGKYLNDEIGLDEMLDKCNKDLEQQVGN